MKILALDTSTNACSAALLLDNESIQRHQIAPQEHSNLILPMIDGLMAEAGISLSALDAIAFGRGPGSFVGVRIAASVTQGIAFAGELPVVAVSSLAALAQGSQIEKTLVAFDARMAEVYWGAYCRNEQNIVELLAAEVVCKPEEVSYPQNSDMMDWTGIGTGWDSYKEALSKRMPEVAVKSEILYPEAKNIAILGAYSYQLGEIIGAQDVHPVYIRNQVVRNYQSNPLNLV